MPSFLHRAALLALLAFMAAPGIAAPAPCSAPSPECVVVGEWDISVSLGVGGRSNPLRWQSDLPLVVIPQVSYYGKRFFLENLELGFTLFENESNSLNVLAAPGYDRAFFYRKDLQNIFVPGAGGVLSGFDGPPQTVDMPISMPRQYEVHRRHTTYLVGPEWTFSYGRWIGQLNALREVTGEHDGYEVRAAVATPIIQSKSSLVVSTGATWKSAELVRYYYGVDGLYEPGPAVNPFLRLGYSRPLSDRWTFSAFAHYEYLDHAVAASPLVADHGVATVFAGIVFRIL